MSNYHGRGTAGFRYQEILKNVCLKEISLTDLKIKFLQIRTYYFVKEIKGTRNQCGCTGSRLRGT